MQDEEAVVNQLSKNVWKKDPETRKFFDALLQQRERLLKEAEQLSASQCEEWQIREKLNSSRTIRNIIDKYA